MKVMWAPLLLGFAFTMLTAVCALAESPSGSGSRPNLVYILMDDTDVLLGSADTLHQTRKLIGDQGATFTHFRTLSPKCTPSRTGQLAGRHYHNLRPAQRNPPGTGRGLNQSTMFDRDALFPQLHAAGYLTSIVGKVHNGQKSFLCSSQNNTDAFDHISTLCSPCGNYFGTEYVVKEIGQATTKMESPLDPDAWSTYSHGQFGNRSAAFMREAVGMGKPFFAYIGTTGPHLPSTPAPWHGEKVRQWKMKTPRPPNFNRHTPDAHPTLASCPKIDDDKVPVCDQNYRDRLGALLSIDDLIAGVVETLESLRVLDDTYIIVSSDHGYHIGNWRLPMEKMWPFETDQRIPCYIRGPGIEPGQTIESMGVNVDIAPTLLNAAGISIPASYDGQSLLPLLQGETEKRSKARRGWRTRTVISFAEGYEQQWGDVTLSAVGNREHEKVDPKEIIHPPRASNEGERYSFDNPENQWRSLRVANSTHNISFVQWDPAFLFHNVSHEAL